MGARSLARSTTLVFSINPHVQNTPSAPGGGDLPGRLDTGKISDPLIVEDADLV